MPTTLACIAALALAPAVAAAKPQRHKATAPKRHAARPKLQTKQPSLDQQAAEPAPPALVTGLGNSLGLGPTMQIAAMTTAIDAAPTFYAGRTSGCSAVTPVLASQAGQTMAGNFRDAAGDCYVWLNLRYADQLTGSDICKLALHEMGHLNGLQHSQDPNDVMYSPFVADPIPAPCQAPPTAPTQKAAAPMASTRTGGAKGKGKAKASSATARACPPGTTNPDYCAAVASPARRPMPHKRARPKRP